MQAPQRQLEVRDLGLIPWGLAYEVQKEYEGQRKAGAIPDQLLFAEHPHVVTMGRNGHAENILANPEMLRRAGIASEQTNRGGDVTYHGPGQIVGYPVFDLREWKRDVGAYLRALEETVIGTLGTVGIEAWRDPSATGVWTSQGKICAMGVHMSRWVTTHGFALNHTTDLSYFRYIVPCGLTRPVTSIEAHGVAVTRGGLIAELSRRLANIFGHRSVHQTEPEELPIFTETK